MHISHQITIRTRSLSFVKFHFKFISDSALQEIQNEFYVLLSVFYTSIVPSLFAIL